MKTNVSTSLEESDVERIERLVAVDGSNVALVARKALLKGLPLIEEEVLGRSFDKSPRKKRLAVAA